MGTAGIQNGPYGYTGINDIFTHAEEDAVEMISEFDRLMTNKNGREVRINFNCHLQHTHTKDIRCNKMTIYEAYCLYRVSANVEVTI